jgi:hypothetical protein
MDRLVVRDPIPKKAQILDAFFNVLTHLSRVAAARMIRKRSGECGNPERRQV